MAGWDMVHPATPIPRMSVEQFLAWDSGEDGR